MQRTEELDKKSPFPRVKMVMQKQTASAKEKLYRECKQPTASNRN